jgi:hypothetical protein
MVYSTNLIFICQFINTGILPTLCSANLEHQLPDLIVQAFGFTGKLDDFDENWFVTIGDTITSSLVINIIFPVIT